MKRKHVLTALIAFAVLAGLCAVFRQRPFATLDLGSGHTLRVYARRAGFQDDMPSNYYVLDYELLDDGRRVWRGGFGGTFTPPDTLQFQVLVSSDRNVVAIVETFAPDIVLYIRDLASGEGWPQQAGNEHYSSVRERGHRLLSRLQPSIQHTLILSSEVKGRETRI